MKVRTKARREAIVKTAAQLFQEMGYERATMNELAKRVGGSKATLYGYFSTKEALFTAVVREHATMHLSEETSRAGDRHAGIRNVGGTANALWRTHSVCADQR